MIKNNVPFFLILITLILSSCSSGNDEIVYKYVVEEAENDIVWTAYKTTTKIPVEGGFSMINITSKGKGNTIKEALNNTEFSIPINSLFSEAISSNIINFFFGEMLNTSVLSGKIVLTSDTIGYVEITMNGITENLPFTYSIVNTKFQLTSIMDLSMWKAENAILALNNRCNLLHMGTDGVVKLWDDVSIEITSTFE